MPGCRLVTEDNEMSNAYLEKSVTGDTNKNLGRIRELSVATENVMAEAKAKLNEINSLKERIINLESKREQQLLELQTEKESVDASSRRIQIELQAKLDRQKKELEESQSTMQQSFQNRLQKATEREKELLRETEALKSRIAQMKEDASQQKMKYEEQLEELRGYVAAREDSFVEREAQLKQRIKELEENTDASPREDASVNRIVESISMLRKELEALEFGIGQNTLSTGSKVDMQAEISEIIQFIELQEKQIG